MKNLDSLYRERVNVRHAIDLDPENTDLVMRRDELTVQINELEGPRREKSYDKWHADMLDYTHS